MMNSKFYRDSPLVNNASKHVIMLMKVPHLWMNIIVEVSDRNDSSQYKIYHVLVIAISATINSHRKTDQNEKRNNKNKFGGMSIIVSSTLSNRFGSRIQDNHWRSLQISVECSSRFNRSNRKKLSMSIVQQWIDFLQSCKLILIEVPESNAPSLVSALRCSTFLEEDLQNWKEKNMIGSHSLYFSLISLSCRHTFTVHLCDDCERH
jgi:hypothetical protein